MMKCPYCVSDIDSQALACKYCKRDVFLPKQLMIRIRHLENQLQSSLSEKSKDSESGSLIATTDAPKVVLTSFAKCRSLVFDFLKFFIAPLMLLLLAHVFITIVYDTKILYLRIFTLVLPMCFGVLLFKNQSRNILAWLIWIVSLGLVSVVAMSAITSLVDDSPVWPQSIYEWREMVEFAASISFSYLTGMFIGRLVFLKTKSALTSVPTAHHADSWMTGTGNERLSSTSLQLITKKISELITTLGAIVATIIAIYTGLKGLL